MCVLQEFGFPEFTIGILIVVMSFIIVRLLKANYMESPSSDQVVVITGCDSGLGFALARHSYQMGLTVFACCLDPNGDGAKDLVVLQNEGCPNKIEIIGLDLTVEESIQTATERIKFLLEQNPDLVLRAIVNNAGVMVFGEFAWQTKDLIKKHINVNFLGTLLFTRPLIPLIRQHSGRIITVTSHCGIEPMPGLSIYSATKAALDAWSISMRVEQAKCNVKVITLIPGSFPTQTRILHLTNKAWKEMNANLEQSERKFYNDYFERYFQFYTSVPILANVPSKKAAADYLRNFEQALMACSPKTRYITEPWRYKFYHFAMGLSPVWIRDWLILKFSCNPSWNGS